MIRTTTRLLVCGAVLLATACAGARVVQQTQGGGEIALEGDRQAAMKKARKHMEAHCQGPYTVIEQGSVAIGEEEGEVASEEGDGTPQTTEWRIEYVCGTTAPPPPADVQP